MEISTLISAILELGLTPALLILFVFYFLKRDKHRDEQLEATNKSRDDKLDAIRQSFREREQFLVAEGVRREEAMRSESVNREQLIRQEAEKRENALMRIIDSHNNNMEKVCGTLDEVKNTLMQMEFRFKSIENGIDGKR